MEYVLVGFRQVEGVRHYGFQGIAEDRSRTEFTVGADMGLLRKYRIAIQDVPLLCRRFLEELEVSDTRHAIMLGEDHMQRFADARSAVEAAAKVRKQHRPPTSAKVGQAWRTERP